PSSGNRAPPSAALRPCGSWGCHRQLAPCASFASFDVCSGWSKRVGTAPVRRGALLAQGTDAQLGKLLRCHFSRSIAHQVGAALGFRKGDHVADALAAGDQHGYAVHSKRDAAMGRGAELQRVEEKSKLTPRLLVLDPQGSEYSALHFGIVETNRAPANLKAIQDQVV